MLGSGPAIAASRAAQLEGPAGRGDHLGGCNDAMLLRALDGMGGCSSDPIGMSQHGARHLLKKANQWRNSSTDWRTGEDDEEARGWN